MTFAIHDVSVKTYRHARVFAYAHRVPKLWSDTIEAHRREVRDAIVDAAARLATERGPLNVTMSQVADAAGIGRATLYKYFSSVEQILHAWHERQVDHHLRLVAGIAARDVPPMQRLTAVLEAYAKVQRQRSSHGRGPQGPELIALLHGDHRLAPAEQELHALLRGLIAQAAEEGQVRSDVTANELTAFCLHALAAAATSASTAATNRLVGVILDGLRARP